MFAMNVAKYSRITSRIASRFGARGLHFSAPRCHGDLAPLLADPGIKKVELIFQEASGKQHRVQAPLGSDLLDIAWHYKVSLLQQFFPILFFEVNFEDVQPE